MYLLGWAIIQVPDFLLGLYGYINEKIISTRNRINPVDCESAPCVDEVQRDDHRNMEEIDGVDEKIRLEYDN